jgi:hypothetical protein
MNERYIETSNLLRPGYNVTAKGFVMQLIRLNASRQPNTISMWVVGSLIVCYCLVSIALSFTILYSWDAIAAGETWALVLVLFFAAVLLLFCILISIQPRQKFQANLKPFKVSITKSKFPQKLKEIFTFHVLGSHCSLPACDKHFH